MSDMQNYNYQTGKKGGRGKETLFRVTFRNQINHTQIADNKAQMIIGINSLIISVLMTLTGFGFVSENNLISSHLVILPITFIILTCLLSVVFAIQAARPKIIKSGDVYNAQEKKGSSLLFFGTISNKSLEEYMKDMDELIHSKDSIYRNMVIDIYYQGKVLSRKYKLLSIAYLIFMYGFVFSVISFLLFFLFTPPSI
jgi:hypothetical protein